jgi:hypothetical protein
MLLGCRGWHSGRTDLQRYSYHTCWGSDCACMADVIGHAAPAGWLSGAGQVAVATRAKAKASLGDRRPGPRGNLARFLWMAEKVIEAFPGGPVNKSLEQWTHAELLRSAAPHALMRLREIAMRDPAGREPSAWLTSSASVRPRASRLPRALPGVDSLTMALPPRLRCAISGRCKNMPRPRVSDGVPPSRLNASAGCPARTL